MNYLLSVFLAVLAVDARAEAAACSPLASPQGVFDCLMKTHPLAKSADALVAQSEALEAAAAQRPNPEAASNAVFGNSQDQIEVSVLHTIETGGKRARRLDRAKAEALELRAEALATKEEIAVGSAVSLFRLRQIREELKLLMEASETFATIAKQLKQRPRRSPEQEVSLSVFQLAGRDYSVRRAGLESEEANLRRQLEFGLGAPLPATDTVLPERPSQWPDPGGAKDPASYRGSAALRAAAAVEVAKAGVAAANAEAYPDIRVGPSLLNQKNGAGQGQATLFGAGFSLPLPLYHRNGGVRKLAVKSA
jgi:outer membrane protein, heavy metal efflux system